MERTATYDSPPAIRPAKVVRLEMANSMVGRTVSLMVNARKITRGIVAGVLVESGVPKIVVNGASYDTHQVLSSCPAFLTR